MVVTSLENERVKRWTKLQKKKYREEFGEYIVEGEHLVLEAYKAGVLVELILEENEDVIVDAPFTYVTKEVIDKISSLDSPCSILGVCKKIDSNEIVGNKILILDDIQDPGNLGTIIRSAVAFNIETIILSENTVDLYNSKVLRATQGMIFHTNIVKMNLDVAINEIKSRGIVVYGTNVVLGVDASTLESSDKEKYALVMGNEGKGVRDEIADICDKNLYININKNVESLNVAIAASILLYELGR